MTTRRYTVSPWDHGFPSYAGPTLHTDSLAEARDHARTATPRGRETSFTGRNAYDITWRIHDNLRERYVPVEPVVEVRLRDLAYVLDALGDYSDDDAPEVKRLRSAYVTARTRDPH